VSFWNDFVGFDLKVVATKKKASSPAVNKRRNIMGGP